MPDDARKQRGWGGRVALANPSVEGVSILCPVDPWHRPSERRGNTGRKPYATQSFGGH